MQFTSTQKRALAWFGLLLGTVAMLWLLAPVLTPFVVAAILAYALTPVVDRIDHLGRGRIPRLLAVVLVEVVFLLMLLALMLLVVPILVKQLPQLREQVPPLLDRFNVFLQPFLAQFGLQVSFDVAGLKDFAMEHLSANFEDLLGQLLASAKLGGSVALSLVGNAVLIPVVLFYLLMEWRRFIDLVLVLVPPRLRPAVDSFTSEADLVLGQYLRGQLLVMVLLAIYYSIGLALFGLDLALPIGVFTGLAVAIPYLGFGLGLILATLAGFLEFSAQAGHVDVLVMVAVVYGLGQLVESFFLTPYLVGERMGLHPVAVIFALLAFGHLLGFVGVLIALPLSAVLVVAIRRMRAAYLESALYQDTQSA
ncbi:MAG: AI-2E family transporter [Comamonadaceae bacterium CG_4_9_14_3_um_filter_60_33]|nr:MAG: AI-2E family transporter [Comamonadaceae bacterium CG2_30_59_20]PIY28638.1 MAG: AI-2E family transporter [Comamonadaceae bacterium CG_4_10_14_3_um_filter_60_42]PJB45936.1 MAG: AI-2E family transporter [Comamonadaceae bacterium CG_4_9_14_3_um_filter_60_33]